MPVDAVQMANLLAIARYGSFTRAAEEKGMSQPALSNSIALLEQRLGVRVLDRSRRGSTLTRSGEILVRRAEGLAALLSDAETEVLLDAVGVSGPLRIGATPSVLPKLLPVALSGVVAISGAINIEVVEDVDQALVPMLLSGAIDIIIGPVGEMFTQNDDIAETALLTDPFAIGAGPTSELRGRTSLALAELLDSPWILPRPGSTFRRHVEALFLTAGIGWPRDCILANSLPLMEAVVVSTNRLTIVSRIHITPGERGIALIPLATAGQRMIGYKIRKQGQLTPIARILIKELERHAATLG